jgi:hypothetical protein
MSARLSAILPQFQYSKIVENMEKNHFRYLMRIAERGFQRMKIEHPDIGDNLIQFLEFCQSYQGRPPNSGAGLNLVTFESFGYFLFGTSSQHRKRQYS